MSSFQRISALTIALSTGFAVMTAATLVSGPVLALSDDAHVIPAPTQDVAATGATETAIFAGGCFWGVQGVFQHVDGVTSAVSGYAGGDVSTAEYNAVGTGQTGHAEAVEVVFDPSRVSYGELLHIYFSVAHDPTQLNRQGPDVGPQYRSAIFATTQAQADVAASYISQLNAAQVYDGGIVTTIESGNFYPAEDYHQDFLTLNPDHPYIVRNDLPKIADLQALFPDDYRDQPVLFLN